VLSTAEHLRATADDPDKAEHFVKVEWIDTVPARNAFKEVGLFGIQHTVCRPTNAKWRHTVERLKSKFTQWDSK